MKLKTNQIEAILRSPPPDATAYLIYGPDEGLVRERGKLLAAKMVDDVNDPFCVVQLTGDSVRATPSILTDEMSAISMLGGRRLIRLEQVDNTVADKVEAALAQPSQDTTLVILAGDLRPGALRKLFEGARKDLVAVPCYRDEGMNLEQVVRSQLTEAGVTVAPDALAYMLRHLGNDRSVTRQEIEKIALFMHGHDEPFTLQDARTLIGDNAADAIDLVAEATTSGAVDQLDDLLNRVWQEGASPVAVLRRLADRFNRLLTIKAMLDRGEGTETAFKKMRIFWKEKESYAAALSSWPEQDLLTAQSNILSAEIDCKTTALPAEAICGRLCLKLAHSRRRKR